MTRASARLAGLGAGLLVLLGGCGGDGGDPSASQRLKDAVAKTEAAGTARMSVEVAIHGPGSQWFSGDVLVDFANDRNLMTLTVEGRELQLYSEQGEEYFRPGTSGRFRPFPESEQSPVANNPADSLKYVATDVVDLEDGPEPGCVRGLLDFDRVIERVEQGREDEVPEGLSGLKAPVVVCVDQQGRIDRYDVEVSAQGSTVDFRSTLSHHGTAPSVESLAPDAG